MSRIKPFAIAKWLAVGLTALLLIAGPIWLVIVNSLKPYGEAIKLDFSLPTEWAVWDNYSQVFVQGDALRGFLNSVLVTGIATAVLLLLGAAASWAFARSTARPMQILYYVMIAGIFLPPTVISAIFLLQRLGIQGQYIGLIAIYVGWFMSMTIFLMTGFVKSVPAELDEAASIDGCGPIRTFFLIILPLLRPVLFTTGVLLAVFLWNDFFYPFFLLQGQDKQTLPLGLFRIVSSGSYQVNWNLVFADVITVSIPMIILFLIGQKRIIAGLLAGSVKG